MAKTAIAEHPDGQDRPVTDQRRGRWKCLDVWVKDANTMSVETALQNKDDEDPMQPMKTMQTTQELGKQQFGEWDMTTL